jgi:hypothetical protein
MKIEQRYVIKFFMDESMPGVEIISRLGDRYEEGALSLTHIYIWINELKPGRIDLNNIARPGREPDDGLAGVIATKLDADPHLSARKLAQSLRIAIFNRLSAFDRGLENEVPSLALGAAYVDSGSKNGPCRIGGMHATGASKTRTQPFSFLVYR